VAVTANRLVGEAPLASPELALVDAELAAELRSKLSLDEDTWLRPREHDDAPPESDTDAPARVESANDHGNAESLDPELHDELFVDEFIVPIPDQTPTEGLQPSSHYPALPAPEPEREVIEETDATLRRIRERLNESDESSTRRDKVVRRPFTLASGVAAVYAVGMFAVDAELHIIQLPAWLPF
jgi:hypothetical protein